ncbi:MAG: LPS export ABC transporter periplasmic protein LptC [Elusimicrobia bacterium RIFOXYB2_FULL_62_6]|nr:MAG: LPS export ABC transporter periplasmic protein LptC [Elusimicrobia bacterium RIFOXYB2_FULL_62_6]
MALLLAAAGCSGRGDGAPAPAGAGLLKGVRLSQMTSGVSDWTLDAKAARLEESETRIYFEGPALRFFDKSGIASELGADSGFLDLTKKDAELLKNVVVVSHTERMTLKTEKLFFSSEKKKIWTDEEVTVLRGKNVMRGSGFTANPDLTEIEITRNETKVNRPSDIKNPGPAPKAAGKK